MLAYVLGVPPRRFYKPFNSLFEMLYLRPYVVRAVDLVTFNSLFEMPVALCITYADRAYILSILYLRCASVRRYQEAGFTRSIFQFSI